MRDVPKTDSDGVQAVKNVMRTNDARQDGMTPSSTTMSISVSATAA